MKVLIGISCIVVIFLILVALNPSKDDYETYCKKLVENVDKVNNIPNNPLTDVLKKISIAIVIQNTERNNYLIYSTYTTNIAGIEATRIGFLGNFSSDYTNLAIALVLIFFTIIAYIGVIYYKYLDKLDKQESKKLGKNAQYKQSPKIDVPISFLEKTLKELKAQLIYAGVFTSISGIILIFVLLSGDNVSFFTILFLIGVCWLAIIKLKIWLYNN